MVIRQNIEKQWDSMLQLPKEEATDRLARLLNQLEARDRTKEEDQAQKDAEARKEAELLSAEVERRQKQKREEQLQKMKLLREKVEVRHQEKLESERRKDQQRWRSAEKSALYNKHPLKERHIRQEQEEKDRQAQRKIEQEGHKEQVERGIQRAASENRIILPLLAQRNRNVLQSNTTSKPECVKVMNDGKPTFGKVGVHEADREHKKNGPDK
uniref:Uncharacterized protein n=1 Tax=Knipowitschia caucasica TaxID=637954 RepID=A0AAV2JIX0_KNICA